MASIVNFNIEQGTTFTSDVTVTDNAGDTFDLTGYSSFALSKVFLVSTLEHNSQRQLQPSNSIITLDLTADQTAS